MQKKTKTKIQRNNITVKHTYEPMCFKGNKIFTENQKHKRKKYLNGQVYPQNANNIYFLIFIYENKVYMFNENL